MASNYWRSFVPRKSVEHELSGKKLEFAKIIFNFLVISINEAKLGNCSSFCV